MENEENIKFTEVPDDEESAAGEAPRARNKTVMLTPDVTGEMRARLQNDFGEAPRALPEVDSVRSHAPNAAPITPPRPEAPPSFGSVPQRPSQILQQPPMHSQPVAPQTPVQPVQPAQPRPLVQRAVPQATATGDSVIWVKPAPIVGFLVSYDVDENGQVFELRSGRLIVSSEPAAGNCLVVHDETVSPMHAILRIGNSGEIQVLDQLSEYGTTISRFGSEEEEELSGDKSSIEHGDQISFGERTFHVCLVALGEEDF